MQKVSKRYSFRPMEQIKHECGIALIRLLKPLNYYKEKYGSTRKIASLLGISQPSVVRKLKFYGISSESTQE